MTPLFSLPLSKPAGDSAWIVTFTLPAMSARFAMAFHAVNRALRSAAKDKSTVF